MAPFRRTWPFGLGLGFVVSLGSLAFAGELDRAVIRELLNESGWNQVSNDAALGLVVSEKKLQSVDATAYLGVRDIPREVDVERLWTLIVDVDGHDRFGGKLAESTVVKRHGAAVDFYQVLKPPPLMASAQRYWFVHTEWEQGVGGVPGHQRRCWSQLSADEATEARAAVAAKYPDASLVPLTHGCWEVLPASGEKPAQLRYRTVSDPGGMVARSLVGMLTSHTLPDNLNTFIEAAR